VTQDEVRYGTQRAAAARNRAVILDAAHDLLADNPNASLNEIAKRAGVGAGTLYRHFPTREDLLLAAYRHDVQRLVDSVDDRLATLTPRQAFERWFEDLAGYIRVKHGLGEALHTAAAQEAINETYEPVTAAIGQLLRAAERSGEVRAGLDPGDVLLLMGFLWRIPPGPGRAEQSRRLIGVVFDGLSPDQPGDDDRSGTRRRS